MTSPADLSDALHDEMSRVLIGKSDLVERLTISLLTDGHVLLEGVPGVAKTTVANLFARAIGLGYSRIQMTPDILPADITGTQIYHEPTGEFKLREGPVFSNVVVADEINRATPKTQSALLEAMQERTVTIGDRTLSLPAPFLVIATQNPIEMEGTFELPAAQRDRFQFKHGVGLPTHGEERALLERFDSNPDLGPDDIEQVTTPDAIISAREAVREVYVDGKISEYILSLVEATRENPNVRYGASPRASLAFLNSSKASAAISGREYVIPDDVKALAEPILIHRLVLSTDAELSDVTARDVVSDVVERVEPPGSDVRPGELTTASDGGTVDDSST